MANKTNKIRTQFVCSNCGFVSARYMGRCSNCGQWGTFVEEKIVPEVADRKSRIDLAGRQAVPQKISDVSTKETPRVQSGLLEFDRALGGGIVPGSLVLIGGDPGIGKSTLMLQVSGKLAEENVVLYVSGEESAQQIKLRAQRLNVTSDQFILYPETDMSLIRDQVEALSPEFLIIDSIQTIQQPDVDSAVGSVAQIREVTAELMQLAKTNGITIFIVGHVTKEGMIAGPKILEHMVDTVLYFEGDKNYNYRLLRVEKNRFGATNELGIFEMHNEGLQEVNNPSEIFLSERLKDATGSAVVAAIEGTRPILIELQALVASSAFGNAQRVVSGLDKSRAQLIIAVLEKGGKNFAIGQSKKEFLLQNQDVFLKAVGGMKLNEPALDLAIAVAIISSYQNVQSKQTDAFVGEVGLTGEIRSVSRIDDRIKEAKKLGFKRIFVPKNNIGSMQLPKGIDVIGVSTLQQAVNQAFDLQIQ